MDESVWGMKEAATTWRWEVAVNGSLMLISDSFSVFRGNLCFLMILESSQRFSIIMKRGLGCSKLEVPSDDTY